MAPDGFFRGVTEYPFGTLVPTGDDAVKVLADNGIVGGGYNGSQQTRYFFCLLPLAHILIVVTTQPPYLLGCPRTPGEALDQSAHFHLTNGKVFRRHVSPLAALARTALHASHSDQRCQIQ